MSLIKSLITEIISHKKYIFLPDELGSWTDPLNEKIKNYIWESDYISKAFKKDTLIVNVRSDTQTGFSSNITFVPSHELSFLDELDPLNLLDLLIDARDEIRKKKDVAKGIQMFYRKNKKELKRKKTKKLINFFHDFKQERTTLYKQFLNTIINEKPIAEHLEYPIVASLKNNKILFDHSLYYFLLKVFNIDLYNSQKDNKYYDSSSKLRKFGCGASSYYKVPMKVINIDQAYSLDSKEENPFPVEKDSEEGQYVIN